MQPIPTKNRLAIYGRVSTEEQRQGHNIDSQIAELEQFGKQHSWNLIDTYPDEGWSGSVLARPQLDRCRDDAAKGRFDAVLVNDVDRLARDVTHLGIIKRDLEKHGVRLIFRKLPAEQSPTNNLMVNILGSFAEFERELIADRTRRGRRHKVEMRKQFLGCLGAYGLRYIRKNKATGKDGYLEVASKEVPIVKNIYRWVDREGLSARKVIARLNALGVPTRKGGAAWQRSSVMKILRNEMYAGVWYYNKHEGCEPVNPRKKGYRRSTKTSLRRRPRADWLPVVLPKQLQIIQRDQWERVQKQLDRNRAISPRNTKHPYLLRGLILCGGCGSVYAGTPCHRRFYYRCITRCKKRPTITENIIDQTVWTAIREAVLNPDLILAQVKNLNEGNRKRVSSARNESSELDRLIEGLEKEESRILEAYRMEILSPAQLAQEMQKLTVRRTALQTQKAELSQQVRSPESARRSVMEYCKAAARQMDSFNFEERQRFLRLLIRTIVFNGDRITVRGVIPVSENEATGNSTEESPQLGLSVSRSAAGNIATTASYTYGHNNNSGGLQFVLERAIVKPLVIQPRASNGQYCRAA